MKRQLSDKLLWLCLLLLTVSVTAFNTSSLSSISVLLFTVLMLLVYAYFHKGEIRVRITKYHRMVVAFALFCMCSAVWAKDSKAAITDSITIFEILICMSVIYCCFQGQNSVRDMLTAIMWSGPILALYTVYYYGPSMIVKMIVGSIRISEGFANANTIGIWATISAILFYYFVLHDGWKWKYCAIVLPIVLVALSQSRKAALMLILALLMIQIFKNGFEKKGLKGLIGLIFGLAVIIIGLVMLSRTQLFAGMMKRITRAIEDFTGPGTSGGSVDVRKLYSQVGLEQFLKTPLLGIGIRNSYFLTREATGYTTYLHNNFVELLACGGIVGFFLYYRIIFYLVTRLWRSVRRTEQYSDICLVILLVYTAMEVGFVSYYSKRTYLLLLICYLQTVFAERDSLQENKFVDAGKCTGE